MRYLSRVTLDPKTAADTTAVAQALCGEGYGIHQQIWKLFEQDPEAERDFLYRQESRGAWPRYLVLSRRPPKEASGPWMVEVKEYKPSLYEGQRLAFSLRVNPVVTRKGGDGKSRRHDVVMDAKRQIGYRTKPAHERPALAQLAHEAGCAWLQARAERHGFTLDVDALRVDGYQQNVLHKKGRNTPIRFSTLEFEGALTVSDPDRMRDSLYQGIGPAKGFGCGLLLIRRV